VIIHMTRIRIAGPRTLLERTLRLLQDLEIVHVTAPLVGGHPERGAPDVESPRLRRVLEDAEAALRALGVPAGEELPATPPQSLPRAALLARRTRRKAEALARQQSALADERVLLLRYREFFRAFAPLLDRELTWPDGHAFYVVLREGAGDRVERLRASLEAAVDGELEVLSHALPTGETAVLLLASRGVADKVGQLLAASRVQELPSPPGLGDVGLARALPALEARLAALPLLEDALTAKIDALRESAREALGRLRSWLHDRLLVLEASQRAHRGPHLFVVEGWAPQPGVPALAARVQAELGPDVLVEAVATEPWNRADAPVALRNPPIFRPFEVITSTLPLPRYGTIDPTPFVAVFFPMFFGLMLGDVGYGVLLGLLSIVIRARTKPGTRGRSIAAIGGACALFSIAFGFVFGELFGDLGARAFHFRPHGFDRGGAILPFLALTGALGAVHVTLGIVLAVLNAWRQGHRREALGRGVAAAMVTLTILALLAAFKVLPSRLFTPFVITVLVAFPVLVLLEGVVAIVELVSNFGQILSYARIMAIGTASLMLAVVANQMVGAMGSVLVGVLFALLFHVVNFGIGLFSPTIHALRLHYVEFFGRFFSPGGTAYRPLTHWHPGTPGA